MAEIKTINGRGLYDTVARQKCENLENNKANKVHTHTLDNITETTSKKIMTASERTKLSGISEGANNYAHPSSHPASMITGFSDAVKSCTDSIVTETGEMPVNGSAVNTLVSNMFSLVGDTLNIYSPDYIAQTASIQEVTNDA